MTNKKWEILNRPEYKAVYVLEVTDEEHKEVIGNFGTIELAQYIVDLHNRNIGLPVPRPRRPGLTNQVNFDFLANGHCLNCGSEIDWLHFNVRVVWCENCGWARGWSELVWPQRKRIRPAETGGETND